MEDEIPLSNAVRIKLEKEGFNTVSARTVQQALEYLEAGVEIDVIWLDHYLLGKENGLDFVAKIKRTDSKWKNLPIFVVSNTASHEKVQTYLKLGVDKYYIKAEHRLDDIVKETSKYK